MLSQFSFQVIQSKKLKKKSVLNKIVLTFKFNG